MDFDFDNLDISLAQEHKTTMLLYGEGEFGEKGELIQRFTIEHLADMQIDCVNKVFHAQYGEGRNGFETGEVIEIKFYQMVIA